MFAQKSLLGGNDLPKHLLFLVLQQHFRPGGDWEQSFVKSTKILMILLKISKFHQFL